MKDTFIDLLDTTTQDTNALENIWFAKDSVTPPTGCYQVNFPRLELVFQGSYENQIDATQTDVDNIMLSVGDALFIPANAGTSRIGIANVPYSACCLAKASSGSAWSASMKIRKGFTT